MITARWTDADLTFLQESYELLCTSRMNAIYYAGRLARLQTHSFWMDLTTAIVASGSGLAAVIQSSLPHEIGHSVWQALSLIAAAVAVIRPIYAPGKRIESLTRHKQGYEANFFALKALTSSIRQDTKITGDHRRRYTTCFERHVKLSLEDEAEPDHKRLEVARKLAEDEFPPTRFWWPLPDEAAQKS
jgi:hypothetical protein